MAFGLPAFLLIAWVVMGGLCLMLLSFLIAWQFRKIALQKGHGEWKWFWFCFLLGLPGWLMVVALPDLPLRPPLENP